jgi:hypothetical protein
VGPDDGACEGESSAVDERAKRTKLETSKAQTLGKEVFMSVLVVAPVHFVSKVEETDHQNDVSLPATQ